MNSALAYLTARTMRNRIVSMARRLKQPRYAIGFVFVALYFGFFIVGNATGAMRPPSQKGAFQSDLVRAIAPAILAIVLIGNWIGGNALSALAFTQSEVAMLFPSPLTRRSLILYKIARAQLPILFNVFIWTMLWGGGRSSVMPRWLTAIGLFAMFTTIHLHRIGAALVLVSFVKHGRSALKRNWASYLIAAVVMATMVLVIMDTTASRAGHPVDSGFAARVTATLSTPLVHAVLTPFALITAPTFARTPVEWSGALAGVLAMLALHLVWVLRSQAAFEEAAAEQSLRLHAMIESWRKRGIATQPKPVKGGRFTLALRPIGHPAVAIIWKNSLNFVRTFQPSQLLLLFGLPVIGGVVGAKVGEPAVIVAVICGTVAFILLLAGGITVRNDLRSDLQNLSSLKTMPLRGSQIVFAEISSSALPLALLQCLLVWIGIVALQVGKHPMPAAVALALGVTVPAALAGLNVLASTIRNGIAVLFPAFVRLGADGGGGVEVLGQAMLSVLAMLIGLIVLMIVPGLFTFVVLGWIHPSPAMAVTSIIVLGSAMLIGESYLVMQWIGRVLERTEPSASLSAG